MTKKKKKLFLAVDLMFCKTLFHVSIPRDFVSILHVRSINRIQKNKKSAEVEKLFPN